MRTEGNIIFSISWQDYTNESNGYKIVELLIIIVRVVQTCAVLKCAMFKMINQYDEFERNVS